MKSILQKILILISLIVMTSVSVLADEMPITVWVDGKMIEFDTQPVLESDRTLVPMRAIFEALGAEVSWEEATSTALAKKDDISIEIAIDSDFMMKNGQKIPLDVPARLIGDRTLVPVRAISESFDATVEWLQEENKVIITPAVEEEKQEEIQNPENTVDETTTQAYIELSEEDMQLLKDRYNNLIRYGFEQFNLPNAVLAENEEIADEIIENSETAKDLAFDTWNSTVMENIIQILTESETKYVINVESADALEASLLKIVSDAGLEAHDYFDVSFETLYDGSVMMLITFDKTDTILACKYIGVVVRPDKSIRYFTAETDLLYPDYLFFCEITTDNRGTYSNIGFGKEDFIDASNIVLKQNMNIYE